MSATPSRALVTLHGATVFLGAFLLFQVQLVIGKYILPWYGGVPMVWTICMLCFQVLLLAGYAYAHLLVRRLPARSQRRLHLAVIALSLVALALLFARWGVPLLPGPAWKPDPADTPAWHIVRLLAVAIGAPFFVLATTSPLVQAWFGAAFPTSATYRLYALSNAGSLLALLSYPALVEVWLPVRAQAWAWTVGYALFAIGVAACAVATRSAGAAPGVVAAAAPAPRAREWLLWLVLSATASALLLATTNYVSQEIAVIPFLWIIPLSLYLASFVLTFESERGYARGPWAALLVLGITLSVFVIERDVSVHVVIQIGVAAFVLFAACMVCHGELARTKPHPTHLTSFYLAVTVGGALGGALVSLAAPVVFSGTWEYPLGLWLAAALALVAFARDRGSPLYTAQRWTFAVAAVSAVAVAAYVFRQSLPWTAEVSDPWLFGAPAVVAVAGFTWRAWGARRAPGHRATGRGAALTTVAVALAVIVVGVALARVTWTPLARALEHARSFYGIVHVESVYAGGDNNEVQLRHGRIVHGKQYRRLEYAREPTTYYGRDSGVGLAIEHHPRREAGLRVGVVGLGAGTLAAYGRAGDTYRFYELNPDVNRVAGIAGQRFSFVRDSEAKVEIVIGDARLMLDAERTRGVRHGFDVLAIDAFSSDAIPTHLLTREAVRGYLDHLDAGGILAIHMSNRYVDLKPVIRGLARHFGLVYVFIPVIDGNLTWRNDWALLTPDPARLAIPQIVNVAQFEPSVAPVVVWTDDYSNLIRLLKLWR